MSNMTRGYVVQLRHEDVQTSQLVAEYYWNVGWVEIYQWRWPRPIFVVYRLVAASYVIAWNIYGYVTIPTFGHHVTIVFYTNWSYLVLGLHLTLALLITLFHSARRKDIRGASNQHQCGGQTNGSHVIATWCGEGTPSCGGEGTTINSTTSTAAAPHQLRSEESPRIPAVGGRGVRKQRPLKYNNNEYKTDDIHRKRHPPEHTSGQSNGVANCKRRSKIRDHTEQIKGAEGDAQSQSRPRSIGVLCAGISASQTPELEANQLIKEGRNRLRHSECDENVRHAHTSTSRKSSNLVGPGRTTEHKPQGRGENHPNASALESQQKFAERKQRRRRHSKVCHRTGRAVAFKCKSSNSSLEKIRSKGRRFTSGSRRKGSKSTQGGAALPASYSGSGGRADAEPSAGTTCPEQRSEEKADVQTFVLERTAGKHRRHRRLPSRPRHQDVAHLNESRIKPRVCSTALPFIPDDLEMHRSRHKNRKHTIILNSYRKGEQIAHQVHKDENVTVIQPKKSVPKTIKANNSLVRSEENTTNAKNTRSVGTNTSETGVPLSHRISYVETQTCCLHHRPNEPQSLPLYTKISWVLFNIAVVSATVVSAVYFFILFPMLIREEPNYRPGVLDINLHGINSLIVFLEISLSAIPVRIMHFVYPLAYGLTYVVFSVAYWALDKDNNILYPVILDWNNPGTATAVVIGIVLIATPLFQCLIFALYRLRIFIFNKIYASIDTNGIRQRRETEV